MGKSRLIEARKIMRQGVLKSGGDGLSRILAQLSLLTVTGARCLFEFSQTPETHFRRWPVSASTSSQGSLALAGESGHVAVNSGLAWLSGCF